MVYDQTRGFSQGTSVSLHSKTTEMPESEPGKEILYKLYYDNKINNAFDCLERGCEGDEMW